MSLTHQQQALLSLDTIPDKGKSRQFNNPEHSLHYMVCICISVEERIVCVVQCYTRSLFAMEQHPVTQESTPASWISMSENL